MSFHALLVRVLTVHVMAVAAALLARAFLWARFV